jgi:hypothetical protein
LYQAEKFFFRFLEKEKKKEEGKRKQEMKYSLPRPSFFISLAASQISRLKSCRRFSLPSASSPS